MTIATTTIETIREKGFFVETMRAGLEEDNKLECFVCRLIIMPIAICDNLPLRQFNDAADCVLGPFFCLRTATRPVVRYYLPL